MAHDSRLELWNFRESKNLENQFLKKNRGSSYFLSFVENPFSLYLST